MWLGRSFGQSRALTFSTVGGASWVSMLILVLILGAAISPAAAEPARTGSEPSVSLPPVTVEGTRRRPPRVRQAAPQPKRVAPVQRSVAEPPVERANGPVVGYVAGRSATATKTDTPILETPQ